MSKVFVSGVAGFLGSHLADALLAQGHEVVGIDNLIGGDLDNVPAGVDFHQADCNNLPLVRVLMRGVDVVYHLAATAHEGLSVFSPHENTEHGIYASTAIFSAAAASRVRRVVFTSSMARYGTNEVPFREDYEPRPQDPYGIDKVASESKLWLLSRVHGFEAVVAVPHNIIGPRQRYVDPHRNVASIMINLMLQGRQPIVYGDGSQKRCFSFVSDVVDPLLKMGFGAEAVGHTVNIGPDDEFVTVLDLAHRIAAQLDFPLDPVFVPARPQEVHHATCSADKARRLLGYEARVKLDEGLAEMIAWIRARGPRPFDYRMQLEIDNAKTPRTWKERLF